MDHRSAETQNSSSPKIPGLYVHIPFCRTKCPYCSFYSISSPLEIPDFLDSLLREMEMVASEWDCFDSVYIGGGTPSVLSPRQLEMILSTIRNHFPLLSETEITLEANPADLDLSYLASLREIGVTRLSLGIQSFEPKTLEFLGRRHSVQQAISGIEISRRAGF
ncbi:MAG TPA: radical SAM protein, partial [Thermodesulfobacteriota bacterium]|nr:radical SAM protein [Thermodesulfobacteriota bacterium]